MLGLSTIGWVHTLVSLVAVAYGVIALRQSRQITPATGAGRVYIVTTLITAATGLMIYARGSFGPPHVLSVLTILALADGLAAALKPWFGRASATVQTVAFSSTLLFHAIPAVTETTTRLPVGAPLFASPEAPQLQAIYGVLLLLFAVGLALQLRWLRGTRGR